MKRIALISSHPIQYNAPLFRRLACCNNISLKVFYTAGERNETIDAGFEREIVWDVPLLDGYEFEFLENDATNPGLGRFRGIQNQQIIDSIIQFNPGIILVYGWSYASHLRVMRHFSGNIPLWFRGDSNLLDEKPGLKKAIRRIFLQWIYKHIDKVLYVGEANKRYFLVHGVRKNQLVFVPHSVDNDYFFDSGEKQFEEKAKKWREELGIPENAIVFLFAGKFIPKKDPLLLIKAFKQLYTSTLQPVNSQTHPPVYRRSRQRRDVENPRFPIYLILVGNGPLESQLKKEASDTPNILFLPFQNQSLMPIVYRLGDMFVLPSKGPGETWGLAINEAMACSRPVVASNRVGCTEDLIREGQNGYVFVNRQVEDLRSKMELMIENNTRLKTFGNISKSIIQDYSYHKFIEAIEQLIKY